MTKKRRIIDYDITKLQLTEKSKRIVQCFLDIECESNCNRTPQQTRTLRKKVIQEVAWANENIIFYDFEEKRKIPLWHKLFVSSYDYEGRSKELRYLLCNLARLLKNCDNRKPI